MKLHKTWIVTALVLAAFALPKARAQFLNVVSPEAMQQISALETEKENRTPAQKKIDSALLYSLKMERGEAVAPGIQTMSVDVGARGDGQVAVTILAKKVDSTFLNTLQGMGVNVLRSYPQFRTVQATALLRQLETIAELPQVDFIRPPAHAMTSQSANSDAQKPLLNKQYLTPAERAERVRQQLVQAGFGPGKDTIPNGHDQIGSRSAEGVITHGFYSARGAFNADGTGVRIGVLSDSCRPAPLAASQASGDMPPTCSSVAPAATEHCVLVVPGQDGPTPPNDENEGLGMMEVIHDLVPGAQLYFATAFQDPQSFAQNIRDLRNIYHCDIIVDDVSYSDESPFQDGHPVAEQATAGVTTSTGGLITQAVEDVITDGAMYFSSAANSGNKTFGTSGTFEGDFVSGGASAAPLPLTGNLHQFAAGQNYDPLTGSAPYVDLFWADPLAGSANDYDLFILNSAGTTVLTASTNVQSGTQDPWEECFRAAGYGAGSRIVVLQKTGAANRFFHLATNRGLLSISTSGETHGHNAAASAFGVAATPAFAPFNFNSPPTFFFGPYPNQFSSTDKIETFSSDGPRRMFFKGDGTLFGPAGNFSSTGGVVFQQPLITAADGQEDTGNGGFFSPFYGTSCAAPTGAAVAGLIKSANTALTPAQIRNAMLSTAIDIDTAGPDRDSGYGIVMPYPAMQSVGLPGKAFVEFNTYTVGEACGNGDGLLSPGETGMLTVNLKNTGLQSANSVTAVLSSSTAGVTVSQPGSSYPNLAIFGAGSDNTSAFKFTLDPSVPTDAVVNFTLTVNYTNGWNPSQVINFTVQTGRQPITTVIDSAAPAPSSSFPQTATGLQNGRLSRADPPGSCGVARAFPGIVGGGALNRRFDSYTFTNPTSAPVCVSATLTPGKELTDFLQAAAYLGSFNPSDISENYLSDIGTSPFTDPKTFSFTVPANATVVIVVNETLTGGPSATTTPYTLQVSGLPLAATTTPCPALATPTLTTQANPNSTSLGGTVRDTATLSGGTNATGTITFNLYGPDDATCSTAAVFTSVLSVFGNGSYDSATFTPTAPGTYRWVATYSGDAGNSSISTTCGDPNETVEVNAVPVPTPTATATATATASPIASATATATATPTASPASQALNLSTRMRTDSDNNVAIGGFTITGSVAKHVIIRALGPSLTKFGFSTGEVLADPTLEVHGPGAFGTITNNNWRDSQEAQIKADGLAPTNDLEAAIDATLPPGAYTAIVSGNGNPAGLCTFEVYDLDTVATSKLANLSTRAFVGTGNNVVIAGFVLGNNGGNDNVVVRGLGPSLASFGIANTLADPTLELRDENGALLISNNDWQDDPAQEAQISAAGLAPTDAKESAIAATLPPGLYTAILAGANNGQGVGTVEVYDRGP